MIRSSLASAAVALLGASAAAAHPLDPALLVLDGQRDGTFEMTWRAPFSPAQAQPLEPVLPAECRVLNSPDPAAQTSAETGGSTVRRARISCGAGGLNGKKLEIRGLVESRIDTLVRIRFPDGRLVRTVLRGDAPAFIVQEKGPVSTALDYVRLGTEHLATGFDHLLFIFGLVLLVRGRTMLLWTVTAFTLGHSVTLSLAALGWIHVPPGPVEALIALSIFAVGVELSRPPDQRSSLGRSPARMAGLFGLLHGLGFAGALAQIGLPDGEIPLALFSFNVGLELGQLAFIGLCLVAWNRLSMLHVLQRASAAPAYVIGTLSSYWMFERVAALVPMRHG